MPLLTAERFWERVDRTGQGCWPWIGPRNHGGYGKCQRGGVASNAHRIAWELTFGLIPPGLSVLHLCDSRLCCRPSHLVLGSPAANMADMAMKGRALTGDRNPARLHPDRLARGERHGSRTRPERLRRGERNPAAKLTAGDVREIRQRYAAGGATQRALAAEYGVAQAQVWNALRGRTWRHVA